jgi:hypothetical protein
VDDSAGAGENAGEKKMTKPKGVNSHPLCDIFFHTGGSVKELVLIDITGGSNLTALDKETKLAKWIKKEQQPNVSKATGWRLGGVILAPFADKDAAGELIQSTCRSGLCAGCARPGRTVAPGRPRPGLAMV